MSEPTTQDSNVVEETRDVVLEMDVSEANAAVSGDDKEDLEEICIDTKGESDLSIVRSVLKGTYYVPELPDRCVQKPGDLSTSVTSKKEGVSSILYWTMKGKPSRGEKEECVYAYVGTSFSALQLHPADPHPGESGWVLLKVWNFYLAFALAILSFLALFLNGTPFLVEVTAVGILTVYAYGIATDMVSRAVSATYFQVGHMEANYRFFQPLAESSATKEGIWYRILRFIDYFREVPVWGIYAVYPQMFMFTTANLLVGGITASQVDDIPIDNVIRWYFGAAGILFGVQELCRLITAVCVCCHLRNTDEDLDSHPYEEVCTLAEMAKTSQIEVPTHMKDRQVVIRTFIPRLNHGRSCFLIFRFTFRKYICCGSRESYMYPVREWKKTLRDEYYESIVGVAHGVGYSFGMIAMIVLLIVCWSVEGAAA